MPLAANGCTKQRCAKAGRAKVVGALLERAGVGLADGGDEESEDGDGGDDDDMDGAEQAELVWAPIEGSGVTIDEGGWPVFPKSKSKKDLGRLQVVNGRGAYVTCFRTPSDDTKQGRAYKFRELWDLTDSPAPLSDALLYATLCNTNLQSLKPHDVLKKSTVVGILHKDGYTGSGHKASSSSSSSSNRGSSSAAAPAKRRRQAGKGWAMVPVKGASSDHSDDSDYAEVDATGGVDAEAVRPATRSSRSSGL